MSMKPSASAIRQGFIDFFIEKAGHDFMPSSSVIPLDDPTLLFTNAGMNQFKDVFLGQGTRDCTRAVNSQKCIRAGGKHNDLEDVGQDTYHHTFFEMLGNWSFGDYFKAEAIAWAWELMTEVWGLDKERLHVTVFAGDETDGTEPDVETERLWQELTDINPEHITRWGKKDNFWEMGPSGPCGPCSEIHYDRTPDGNGAEFVNLDHPDVIEFWNLVFIEFNRREDGTLVPLPSRHIDTGMGLERIVRIIQDKSSNYDTDLWTPIFKAIQDQTGAKPYGGRLDDPVDTAYRVIADHARCLVIALTDGGRPGNEGRGYVLRRILRRAVRIASQALGVQGPMLCDLVPTVVDSLSVAYPALVKHADQVALIIRQEEEAFLKTLDRGLQRFGAAVESMEADGDSIIPGEVAFQLHDTYGFPIDLTEVMASERGMQIDRDAYDALMDKARATSRKGEKEGTGMSLPADAIASLGSMQVDGTRDEFKFDQSTCTGTVKAIWSGGEFSSEARANEPVGLVLDQTNFYAEQGGQVADTGDADSDSEQGGHFRIDDARRFGDFVLHVGSTGDHSIEVGDTLTLQIDEERRRRIEANHTATHLMNHALRAVLGDDVEQRGSLVADDRLRFDFSQARAMTPGELLDVEQQVRRAINEDQAVHAADMELARAMEICGIRAVFGERYPDPVRVVSIGVPIDQLVEEPATPSHADHAIEFCGGTHLRSTGETGDFLLLSEQGLASGVRRITALTGDAAGEAARNGSALLEQARAMKDLEGDALIESHDTISSAVETGVIGTVHRNEIQEALEAQRERLRSARKQASSAGIESALDEARAIAEQASGPIIVGTLECDGRDSLMAALDHVRSRHDEAACMLIAAIDAKVALVARVPDGLISRGLKAGDWVREAAMACGGKGGGRPDMAQAGGKEPGKIREAAGRASEYAEEVLA